MRSTIARRLAASPAGGLVRRLNSPKTRRPLLVGLVALVVLAVAGTTFGYSALTHSVTVSLDGKTREVTAFGGTVGDVLRAEGIELGEHDQVAPGLDEEVEEGSRIAVQFARPLTLSVDGKETTHWVTATSVAAALGQLGRTYEKAALSVSRSAGISRDGLALQVITPKTVKVRLAGAKPTRTTLTVSTVGEALTQLGVTVEKRDEVAPAVDRPLTDGDTIVFTDVEVLRRTVTGETIAFETVERPDDSMFEGDEETVKEGRNGLRDVTYRIVKRNGEVVRQTVVTSTVTREPVDEVVRVGTKEEPAPAANYAGGSTVWDRLAQCESGGNWATNTGNGYYGGLQFSASTWRSVGGSGLPHQHSREEQIKRGQILQSRAGWGQWPHCAAQLGLI